MWLYSISVVGYPPVSYSVLAKRLAGKSDPKMTYFVSSGTLKTNSISQRTYLDHLFVCGFVNIVLMCLVGYFFHFVISLRDAPLTALDSFR